MHSWSLIRQKPLPLTAFSSFEMDFLWQTASRIQRNIPFSIVSYRWKARISCLKFLPVRLEHLWCSNPPHNHSQNSHFVLYCLLSQTVLLIYGVGCSSKSDILTAINCVKTSFCMATVQVEKFALHLWWEYVIISLACLRGKGISMRGSVW